MPQTLRCAAIIPVGSYGCVRTAQSYPERANSCTFSWTPCSGSGRNGPVFPVPAPRVFQNARHEFSKDGECSVMSRKIAVGILALALAGCAQSRPSLPTPASPQKPVGMDPVPSISDTINRGTGDPAVVQSTLPDPKNPIWSGDYIPTTGPAARKPPAPQVCAIRSGGKSCSGDRSRTSRTGHDLYGTCLPFKPPGRRCPRTAPSRRAAVCWHGGSSGPADDAPAGPGGSTSTAEPGRPGSQPSA